MEKLSSLQISVILHLALLLGIGWLLTKQKNQNFIEFEIYDAPVLAPKPIKIVPEVQKKKSKKKRGVYGISKKSHKEASSTVVEKEGNTVAKKQDHLKMTKFDTDNLPIPTEEYLISEMPKIVYEYRIPYPAEAKKKRIQGAVVMNLLIDTEGVVRNAELVEGPHQQLNEVALEAVRSFKFTPARVDQKPVAVKIRYVYRFVIE